MANVAMNRAELIEYVRKNFDVDEVFTEREIVDCAAMEHNMVDSDSDYWQEIARDAGWLDPEDTDPKQLARSASARELHLVDWRDVDNFHDDNGHTGAVSWCTLGPCGLNYY